MITHACLVGSIWGSDRAVDFSSEIRPVLAEKCFHCHGPDSETCKADLRLDNREAFADLGGYSAINRQSPNDSELLVRIFDDDAPLNLIRNCILWEVIFDHF